VAGAELSQVAGVAAEQNQAQERASTPVAEGV
jgi:hypothetical protein